MTNPFERVPWDISNFLLLNYLPYYEGAMVFSSCSYLWKKRESFYQKLFAREISTRPPSQGRSYYYSYNAAMASPDKCMHAAREGYDLLYSRGVACWPSVNKYLTEAVAHNMVHMIDIIVERATLGYLYYGHALVTAAYVGSLECVIKLWKQPDEYTQDAVLKACINTENYHIIDYLHKNHLLNPQHHYNSFIIQSSSETCLRRMIEWARDKVVLNHNTALILATNLEHKELISILLEEVTSVDDAMELAMSRRNFDLVKTFLALHERKKLPTPLNKSIRLALYMNELTLADRLLPHSSYSLRQLIRFAMIGYCLETIKYLVDRGAKIRKYHYRLALQRWADEELIDYVLSQLSERARRNLLQKSTI